MDVLLELKKDGVYAVGLPGALTPTELNYLGKEFAEKSGATAVFLDPGMTIQELDREKVYAFRLPGITLAPYQIEAFRKSLQEGPRIAGVFLDNHVELGELTFADYDAFTKKTAKYPELGETFIYPTLGALGEGGEVLEKVLA